MRLKDEKVELLRNVDIFSQLREYELDTIAKYSDFITLKKGEPLFRPGDESFELYVVGSGRIGIISFDGNSDAVIAQIAPGESLGELDFFGRTERNAAAFADEDSSLLRFPAAGHRAEEIFFRHSFIFAHVLYRLLSTVSERIWNVNRLLFGKTEWLKGLHRQLLCDKMTGLYNQIFLKEDFVNLLPGIGSSTALIMIKPDNFKEINDRFGHETGDAVLNLMAIFLQSELLEDDIGVRYRGDEYAAIIPDADRDDAIRRAEEIRAAFNGMDLSAMTGANDIKIQVSIGIAVYPDDADNSSSLVSAAHRKMFTARENGGGVTVA
ncbi:MAG TPA: GGDEF domain-containing protein [Spirochaetota bacterium]|nr:GGDEF domain-containing protein [Spirochaetota bacterium]HPJ34259.1 GGDEF domain-containing protein [Spirochaetota bacterium]